MKSVTPSLSFTPRSVLNFNASVAESRAGFTYIELIVVVAVIGILLTLLVPAVQPVRDRIERIVCTGNLRSIHTSLSGYLIDNQQWPQGPLKADRVATEKFWITTLQDYGARPGVWLCPTLKRRISSGELKAEEGTRMHYIPAQFDDKQATPHKWPGMPWVIEMGNMHHCGNLLIRSDGAIQCMDDVLRDVGAEDAVGAVSVHQLK